eukprot:365140-Chlamydomonas_euryale.AAC.2
MLHPVCDTSGVLHPVCYIRCGGAPLNGRGLRTPKQRVSTLLPPYPAAWMKADWGNSLQQRWKDLHALPPGRPEFKLRRLGFGQLFEQSTGARTPHGCGAQLCGGRGHT